MHVLLSIGCVRCSSSQASLTGLSDGTHRSRLSISGAVFFIVSRPSAESRSVTIECVTLVWQELPAHSSAKPA